MYKCIRQDSLQRKCLQQSPKLHNCNFPSVGLKVNFHSSAQLLRCRTVTDCDGERTASYQPAPDQQSPSYPNWKYTRLPVTGLAHGALVFSLCIMAYLDLTPNTGTQHCHLK
uniref:Uncharacterized protein n=1 Tax=Lates calcarifer TaxID=8187 RepID=A0A4W6FUI1_LATCA